MENKKYHYIKTRLDETYLCNVPEWVSEDDLPPEDLEIRKALVEFKLYTNDFIRVGFFNKLFNTKTYQKLKQNAVYAQRDLMTVVNKTPYHKAAIRRIVNSMPLNNGGRKALQDYII
jgi:hypothetical protein